MKVREIEKDFGLQTLLGKRGWIADDAVGQGETLDAENYKNIVTGEKMNVTRKNKTSIDGVKFGFPVLLTMNNLFKVKDGSDAVYNRSLILPMTRVRAETEPEPTGYDSISEKIISEELTGVFWWALEGWHRLSARGFYDPPKCMLQAISDLQDANNAVGKWARECVVIDLHSKVKPSDLFASFAGWYFQENGDGKFPWSQNGFSRKLKENISSIEPGRESQVRWTAGVSLNEDGLENWSINAARDEYRRIATPTIERLIVNHAVSNEDSENGRTIF
jgi:phage/plasmid-associated DNA primase